MNIKTKTKKSNFFLILFLLIILSTSVYSVDVPEQLKFTEKDYSAIEKTTCELGKDKISFKEDIKSNKG